MIQGSGNKLWKKYRLVPLVASIALILFFMGIITTRIVVAQELYNYNYTEEFTLPFIKIFTDRGELINKKNSILGILSMSLPDPLPLEEPKNDPSEKVKEKNIKIQLHGQFSLAYKQKPYEVNFIDEQKETISIPFFNLPAGEEWIFHAPYVDRSLMRNALAYRLGREIGASNNYTSFAPRSFYTELSINDGYKGLYLVVERNEQGKNRVNIPKTELSKPDQVSFLLEVSSKKGDFRTKYGTDIKYRYPKTSEFEKWDKENPAASNLIKNNIKAKIDAFEDALGGINFKDPKIGYSAFINVDSFVDYIIIQEVTKNVDGYRRSTWFHASDGDKITMGPIWDFDAAFGNLNFYTMSLKSGWVVHKKHFIDGYRPAFWFQRLLKDPAFIERVVKRYRFLRMPGQALSSEHIQNTISEFVSIIGDAGLRQERRWKNTYTNPIHSIFLHARPWSRTFHGNVKQIKKWTSKRLNWIDNHIEKIGYVDINNDLN
ncbi:MAG: CotH kinase family protein [Oligoflexia bacterium]|nr:CotH kinase family protein [Oligoflexia bacterium]